MKLITSLSSTYANVVKPLTENFESIEYQFEEIMSDVDRAAVMCIILEFTINNMDIVDFTDEIRARLGDCVTSSFINTLLLNLNLAVILRTFEREVLGGKLDTSDEHAFIHVRKFGPVLSVLEQ